MTTSTSLRGRRILLTGASSGLGRTLALTLTRAGARVAAVARTKDALDTLAQEAGDTVFPVVGDVTDIDAMTEVAASAARALGGLDTAIANAGAGSLDMLATGDPASWRRIIELNLVGALTTIRVALPHFSSDGCRDVVLVGSTASRNIHPGTAAYSASKLGLVAAAESARLELTPTGVRVCMFEPGPTETGILERSARGSDAPKSVLAGTFDRMPPEVVAKTIVHILSLPAGVEINHVVMRPTGQTG